MGQNVQCKYNTLVHDRGLARKICVLRFLVLLVFLILNITSNSQCVCACVCDYMRTERS